MTDTSSYFHVKKRLIHQSFLNIARRNNEIPGNIYGLGQESVAITLSSSEFSKYAHDFAGGLVYLRLENEEDIPVLIDEIEKHPVSKQILHVVFRRVNLKKAVVSEVSIETVGKCEVSNATVVVVLDSVEVESLPANIPDMIEVDISVLTEVGQVISLNKLNLPKGVRLVAEEDSLDNPVVILQEFKEDDESEQGESDLTSEKSGSSESVAEATS